MVGCTTTGHVVLVEFEGGTRSSVFSQRRGTAQMRDWGAGLQRAFSQVSDWTWAKNESQHSEIYRNAFGLEHMSETYLVVCGRNAHLSPTEKSRLTWRSRKTMIAASDIRFWTYDDLHAETSAALDVFRDLRVEQSGKGAR